MLIRSFLSTFAVLVTSCCLFAQTTATIPHFACGGGWSTTVILTHGLWYPMSSASNPWKLRFVVEVRTQDNKPLYSSLESLPNSNGTYTHKFSCDSEQVQTGRIDFLFFDSDLRTFNRPQSRLSPMAMFAYSKDGVSMEAGLQAQFMSGVDTIIGEDSKGNTTWMKIAPMYQYVPIVQTDGYRHGIAVSNQFDRVAKIRVLFLSQAGKAVYERYFILKPRETTSWTVYEVPEGFIGSVLVYNEEVYGGYAIGLAAFRFSPQGQFTSVFNGY